MKFFASVFAALVVVLAVFDTVSAIPAPEPGHLLGYGGGYGGYGLGFGGLGAYGRGFGGFGGGYGRGYGGYGGYGW